MRLNAANFARSATHPEVEAVYEQLRHFNAASQSLLQLALVLATHEDVALLVLHHVRVQDVSHALARVLRLANHLHRRRVHDHSVALQRSVVL